MSPTNFGRLFCRCRQDRLWEIRVHVKPENRHSGGILKVFQEIRRIIPVERYRDLVRLVAKGAA